MKSLREMWSIKWLRNVKNLDFKFHISTFRTVFQFLDIFNNSSFLTVHTLEIPAFRSSNCCFLQRVTDFLFSKADKTHPNEERENRLENNETKQIRAQSARLKRAFWSKTQNKQRNFEIHDEYDTYFILLHYLKNEAKERIDRVNDAWQSIRLHRQLELQLCFVVVVFWKCWTTQKSEQ